MSLTKVYIGKDTVMGNSPLQLHLVLQKPPAVSYWIPVLTKKNNYKSAGYTLQQS